MRKDQSKYWQSNLAFEHNCLTHESGDSEINVLYVNVISMKSQQKPTCADMLVRKSMWAGQAGIWASVLSVAISHQDPTHSQTNRCCPPHPPQTPHPTTLALPYTPKYPKHLLSIQKVYNRCALIIIQHCNALFHISQDLLGSQRSTDLTWHLTFDNVQFTINIAHWVLDIGHQTLDIKHWTLNIGH